MKEKTLDLTTGSILGKLLRFSLPIILGNLLQELYTIVDTLIVGQVLGVEKLAAVGAAGSPHFLATGFLMGMATGCAVITAQVFGRGDEREVKRSVAAHVAILSSLTGVFTVAFSFGAGPLLQLMNIAPELMEDTLAYLRILYLGIPAVALYNLLASSLRAVGDSKTPLFLLVGSSVLNICLDLLFIIVFHWGVVGAAIATVLAQLVSGLLCLLYVLRKMPLLIPDRQSWRNLRSLILSEMKVGVPVGTQYTVISLGLVVLQGVLNGFGATAVAAYTVGGRIIGLCQNPFVSMGTAMSTFVGQNIGAGKQDRIRQGIRQCMAFTVAFGIVTGLAVWLLARPITFIFVSPGEEEVFRYVKEYLAFGCPLLWTLAVLFTFRGSLQGMGDGLVPMLGGITELIMRTVIPIAFQSVLGYAAVCVAGPAAWAACALLMACVYLARIHRINRKTRERVTA